MKTRKPGLAIATEYAVVNAAARSGHISMSLALDILLDVALAEGHDHWSVTTTPRSGVAWKVSLQRLPSHAEKPAAGGGSGGAQCTAQARLPRPADNSHCPNKM